jgi:serine/threonine protein kinase
MRELPAGDRLGPYQIVAPIGAGGMGKVYRAHDARLGRDVAIKILAGSHEQGQLRRFELEARAAGSLNHPNIVAVHDVGVYEDEPYIVSELLEGRTVRELLKAHRPTLEEATDFALQLARGLVAAHDKGVIHRDLKPENLFVTADGRLKILDFGIAKLLPSADKSSTVALKGTDTGAILGTVGYMSPEQVQGRSADHRSDIFALGVILFELLTGTRPFEGASAIDIGYAIVHGQPRELPGEVPLAIARIVRRCLRKNPADRYQSAQALARELEHASAADARLPARRARPWIAAMLLGGATLAVLLWRHDQQITALVRQKTHADQQIKTVQLDMQRENDPMRLATLEQQLRLLVGEAQAAIGEMKSRNEDKAREWEAGGDETERAIRPVLKKFGAESYAIPPIFKQRVQEHIEGIVSDRPSLLAGWRRRNQYWPVIRRELSANNLPEEIGYLAWTESRFDPRATSPIGAAGMWQLMPANAVRFGLRVDGEVDERLDVEKATQAAARFVANLLAEFGSESFMLALAGYNYGETKLRRELHELRAYSKEDRDFWRLYRLKRLSAETREYVPNVIAAVIVFSDPERYRLE